MIFDTFFLFAGALITALIWPFAFFSNFIFSAEIAGFSLSGLDNMISWLLTPLIYLRGIINIPSLAESISFLIIFFFWVWFARLIKRLFSAIPGLNKFKGITEK